MAKVKAVWTKCGEGNEQEHCYTDFCSSCAPFWNEIPLCPVHLRKLNKSGYCGKCSWNANGIEGAFSQKYYDVTEYKDRIFMSRVELQQKFEDLNK